MLRGSAPCGYPRTGAIAPRGCRPKVPQGMRSNRANPRCTGKALLEEGAGFSTTTELVDEHRWMPGSGRWTTWRVVLGLFIVPRGPIVDHPASTDSIAVPSDTIRSIYHINMIKDIINLHTTTMERRYHAQPTRSTNNYRTHDNYNPYIAIRVGEASHPGPDSTDSCLLSFHDKRKLFQATPTLPRQTTYGNTSGPAADTAPHTNSEPHTSEKPVADQCSHSIQGFAESFASKRRRFQSTPTTAMDDDAFFRHKHYQDEIGEDYDKTPAYCGPNISSSVPVIATTTNSLLGHMVCYRTMGS